MKAVGIFTILLFTQLVVRGNDSAYQALRLVGSGDNQALLNRVIEVRGTKGEPQPSVWNITVDDPSARGGVREFEVSKGKIISEHTPVRAYAGTTSNIVMDFKHLNLDSPGAFTIANQEATKAHVGFDSINYMLRNDDQTNAPVWILRLFNAENANVGIVYIAAETGAVLRTEGFGAVVVPPKTGIQDVYTPPVTATTPVPYDDGSSGTATARSGEDIRPGYEINKGIHKVGASLEEFFTGKRTIDKRFQENHPDGQ